MKNIGRVALLVAIVWIAAAVITLMLRAPLPCGDLFSQSCGKRLLQRLGDAVTFAWVEDWETLAGALIALLAAFIGAHVIRQQMSQTDQIDRAATARRLAASRAVFPLTLSNSVEHVRVCSEALRLLRQHIQAGDIQGIEAFAYPALSSELMTEFKALLEFEGRCEPRNVIVRLLQHLQIMQAGMRHLSRASPTRTHPTTSEVEDVCVKACVAHGHIDMLFDYARGSDTFDFQEASAVWNAASILWYSLNPEFQHTRDSLARQYGPPPADA